MFEIRLFLKREGLLDARVAAINKKEYGLAEYFLQRFIKPLNTLSDELLDTIR